MCDAKKKSSQLKTVFEYKIDTGRYSKLLPNEMLGYPYQTPKLQI